MRIGMIPYLTGDEWETKGNHHLVRLVEALTALGWDIVPLEAGDFGNPKRLAEKRVQMIFIHWPSSIFDVAGFRDRCAAGKFIGIFNKSDFKKCDPVIKKLCCLFIRACSFAVLPVQNTCIKIFAAWRMRSIIKSIEASKVPVVWEIHDLGSHHVSGNFELAGIEQRFHLYLYRICSAIVIHESSCLDSICTAYGSFRSYAVARLGPYSYGPPIDIPDARRRLGIATSGKVFAYIGTARRNRNPAHAAAAFLRVAGEDDRLVVAGMGVGASISSLVGDPRIIVLDGFQPPERMRDIFCSADYVINDAERYLTSAVVRAAMTYGVPVIVRPFGSALDMARGAALFINDGFLDEVLRRALCLDRDAYESLRREARNRDSERTWEGSGRSLDHLFRKIISDSDAHHETK